MHADYVGGEVVLCDESVAFAWVTLQESKQYPLIAGIYDELELAAYGGGA